MAAYETEEQQIEALKKWWKENGKAFVIGATIGVAALLGVKGWFNYQNSQRVAASAEFQHLTQELKAGENQSVMIRADHIIDAFPSTPYAPLAAMALAKVKVEDGQLAAAQSKLQWAVDNARQDDLRHTARLRLARVMLAAGQADQALAVIDKVKPEGFAAAYQEVRGDIYVAMQQPDKARTAYQAALDALQPGEDNGILQMKLEDLGS